MNKNKRSYLCFDFSEHSLENFLLIILVSLNCISCSGQMNQKQNNQAEPSTQTESIKVSKKGNDINLNQYQDNKKDGLWRAYHQNGQLKSEGKYTAGLKEGLHKEWEENGILSVEGYYANGKANGLMKWYHEKGHLAGEGKMIDDIRVGPWKICDIEENGFCIEAYFENGKRHGSWKIYHEHARDKLWKEQTFKDDKMVSEKCWNKNGKSIDCE